MPINATLIEMPIERCGEVRTLPWPCNEWAACSGVFVLKVSIAAMIDAG